jgi:hypothetical protein
MPSDRVPPDAFGISTRLTGLRLVSALKQLGPIRGPVLFQVRSQGIDTHSVDTGGSLVALHMRQRLPQIVSLDNRFHRRPMGRLAFGFGVRRPGFGPFHAGASGFTRRSSLQGDLQFSFPPHDPSEIAVLLAIPSFRPSPGCPAYYAFC